MVVGNFFYFTIYPVQMNGSTKLTPDGLGPVLSCLLAIQNKEPHNFY